MPLEPGERGELAALLPRHHPAAIRGPRDRTESMASPPDGHRRFPGLHIPELELLVRTHRHQLRRRRIERHASDRPRVAFEPADFLLAQEFPELHQFVGARRGEQAAIAAHRKVQNAIRMRHPRPHGAAGVGGKNPHPAVLPGTAFGHDQRAAMGTEPERRDATREVGGHGPGGLQGGCIPHDQFPEPPACQPSAVRTPGHRTHGVLVGRQADRRHGVGSPQGLHDEFPRPPEGHPFRLGIEGHGEHRTVARGHGFEHDPPRGRQTRVDRRVPTRPVLDPTAHRPHLIRGKLLLRRHVGIRLRAQQVEEKALLRLSGDHRLAAVAALQNRVPAVEGQTAPVFLRVVAAEAVRLQHAHGLLGGAFLVLGPSSPQPAPESLRAPGRAGEQAFHAEKDRHHQGLARDSSWMGGAHGVDSSRH